MVVSVKEKAWQKIMSGEHSRDERKWTTDEVSKSGRTLSKPVGWSVAGKSLEGALLLSRRQPA